MGGKPMHMFAYVFPSFFSSLYILICCWGVIWPFYLCKEPPAAEGLNLYFNEETLRRRCTVRYTELLNSTSELELLTWDTGGSYDNSFLRSSSV